MELAVGAKEKVLWGNPLVLERAIVTGPGEADAQNPRAFQIPTIRKSYKK